MNSPQEELALHVLVLRCQAGDELAFAQLMGRFGHRTLRYLRGLVGEAADDVQQEVWLSVYNGLRGLASPGAFRTWLFRTARYRALDHLRRQQRERLLLADAATEAQMSDDPADERAPTLDGSDVGATLDALSPLHREVLVLRYQQDLSYAEVALVVGCSIGTVRSRLHHAKRQLHELLLPSG